MRLERGSVEHPLSNGERFRDIQHSISTVLAPWVSYLIHYGTLLQNATDIITKCDSYFITKYGKKVYYKMHQVFYYKMRQLLQIATILLQNAMLITNCNSARRAALIKNPIIQCQLCIAWELLL